MNNTLKILTVLLFTLPALPPVTGAQENDASREEQPAADQNPGEADRLPSIPMQETDEVFVPTETISEELSVPFPVDI